MFLRGNSVEPLMMGGIRIFDYTQNLKGASSLAVVEVPRGTAHAEAYSRRSDKYYYVVSGSVRFTLGTEVAELRQGDVCWVRRGEHFRYDNPEGETATMVLVHTPPFDADNEVLVERA
jgi:mannose-6-phosphate isomerase-like protein (cupin superfamily)